MCPTRWVRLPLPRLALYPRSPAATAPLLQRGNHRRFESCRGYCGLDWSLVPSTVSPSDAGSNPASATRRSGSVAAARRPGKRGRPGSTPGRTSFGLFIHQDDAAVARRKSGCDRADSTRMRRIASAAPPKKLPGIPVRPGCLADQPQVGSVDQGRCLQGLAGWLMGQLLGG
jgi:hypothetical protein